MLRFQMLLSTVSTQQMFSQSYSEGPVLFVTKMKQPLGDADGVAAGVVVDMVSPICSVEIDLLPLGVAGNDLAGVPQVSPHQGVGKLLLLMVLHNTSIITS
jgi:hypothetical protein